MSKRFGKRDVIFFVILLLISVVAILFFSLKDSKKGNFVQILVDGKEYGTYNLSVSQEVLILNNSGQQTNVLQIKDGQAKMIDADCPDKLCMHQKAISISGANIVCLPNKVIATVIGTTNADELDAIVQ